MGWQKRERGQRCEKCRYLLDLFQLGLAVVHAVCSEVLFWVVTLVRLNGVESGVLKIVREM